MPRAELQTARLTLRPPRKDDAGWIAAEIAVPKVHAMLTAPPRPYGLADAEVWLASARAAPGQYVIEADGPVGVVSLTSVIRGHELGYWLRTSAWGKGYMTEAARAVAAEWFLDGHGDLMSGHLTENTASGRVLGKLGFRDAGTAWHFSGFYGHDVEIRRMALTRPAFTAALPIEARSDRLTYRQWQAIDFDVLHEQNSDWEVVRQLGTRPWPPEEAFTLSRARPFVGNGFAWAVLLHGQPIGGVAVIEGELGYDLRRAHWRQGYGAEIATAALTRAFENPGLDKVTASAWADNAASLGLLAKLGFAETGRSVEMSIARQVETISVHLTLTRHAWEARR